MSGQIFLYSLLILFNFLLSSDSKEFNNETTIDISDNKESKSIASENSTIAAEKLYDLEELSQLYNQWQNEGEHEEFPLYILKNEKLNNYTSTQQSTNPYDRYTALKVVTTETSNNYSYPNSKYDLKNLSDVNNSRSQTDFPKLSLENNKSNDTNPENSNLNNINTSTVVSNGINYENYNSIENRTITDPNQSQLKMKNESNDEILVNTTHEPIDYWDPLKNVWESVKEYSKQSINILSGNSEPKKTNLINKTENNDEESERQEMTSNKPLDITTITESILITSQTTISSTVTKPTQGLTMETTVENSEKPMPKVVPNDIETVVTVVPNDKPKTISYTLDELSDLYIQWNVSNKANNFLSYLTTNPKSRQELILNERRNDSQTIETSDTSITTDSPSTQTLYTETTEPVVDNEETSEKSYFQSYWDSLNSFVDTFDSIRQYTRENAIKALGNETSKRKHSELTALGKLILGDVLSKSTNDIQTSENVSTKVETVQTVTDRSTLNTSCPKYPPLILFSSLQPLPALNQSLSNRSIQSNKDFPVLNQEEIDMIISCYIKYSNTT